MPKTILVTGSRSITTPQGDFVRAKLSELYSPEWETLIEGGAAGVDWCAARWANFYGDLFGLRHYRIPVGKKQWDELGKKAGNLRNLQMLDMGPDLVIAFPTRKSRGTRHCIGEATARGIAVQIFELDDHA